MQELLARAERISRLLKDRGETIVVAESSTGGLVSAALLAMPGASAYFLGGAIVYTQTARKALFDLADISALGLRASTEPYARLLAQTARARFSSTWALGRERRHRADRQSIWRRRRPLLPGRGRTGRARAHAGDRRQRSCRQHAGVFSSRARSPGAGAISLIVADQRVCARFARSVVPHGSNKKATICDGHHSRDHLPVRPIRLGGQVGSCTGDIAMSIARILSCMLLVIALAAGAFMPAAHAQAAGVVRPGHIAGTSSKPTQVAELVRKKHGKELAQRNARQGSKQSAKYACRQTEESSTR